MKTIMFGASQISVNSGKSRIYMNDYRFVFIKFFFRSYYQNLPQIVFVYFPISQIVSRSVSYIEIYIVIKILFAFAHQCNFFFCALQINRHIIINDYIYICRHIPLLVVRRAFYSYRSYSVKFPSIIVCQNFSANFALNSFF